MKTAYGDRRRKECSKRQLFASKVFLQWVILRSPRYISMPRQSRSSKRKKKKPEAGTLARFMVAFYMQSTEIHHGFIFLFLWTGNGRKKSFKEAAYKDRDTDRERYYIDGFDMSKGNEKKRRRAECASCKTRNAHFLSSPTFAHSNLIGGLDKTRGTAS